MMKLYDYPRSSAAYRVRITLYLKSIEYTSIPVNLLANEQSSTDYISINPQGLVPTLETKEGTTISQSLAICEYLEEMYPAPALLPINAIDRAKVRGLAALVASDIHPIANLRVRHYLSSALAVDEAAVGQWSLHWIKAGFQAYEAILNESPGAKYSCGEAVSLADVCLVPQVYNANRLKMDMTNYPLLQAVADRCNLLPAFISAHP
jgi:maleylpyruvate isomerase